MKNLLNLKTDITIDAPLEKVWDISFNRFHEVALFNPNLDSAQQLGDKKGEVGCERECKLDNKTFVRERISSAIPMNTFRVEIYDGNMPMMKEMLADMNFESLPNGKTLVSFDFHFRTSPSFMGIIMKPVMKKKLTDALIGLKFYLETGEQVSKANYKSVYKSFKKLDGEKVFNMATA